MKNALANQNGFLIMDVLIAIMVLAVMFCLFMGAMMQTAKVSLISSQTTEAVSEFEQLIFEIQNGLRGDLAVYGGEGPLKDKYRYKIVGVSEEEHTAQIKSILFSKNGKEMLGLDAVVLRAGVQ